MTPPQQAQGKQRQGRHVTPGKPVLTIGTRGSPLALAKATLDQLVIALDLLGIDTPERM